MSPGAEAKDTFENVPLRVCLLHCTTRRRCQSFNYNSRLGTCEIYQQTICSRESYYLENSADWSWYDVILSPGSQSQNLVWSDDICQTGGRCQDAACLRELGDGCRADVQCSSAVTEGEASCTGGVSRACSEREVSFGISIISYQLITLRSGNFVLN